MNKRVVLAPLAVAVLLAVLVLSAATEWTFPPAKPYDPRPLMAELEKRITTDQYTFLVTGDIQGSAAFHSLAARMAAVQPDFVILTGDQVQEAKAANYGDFEKKFGAFMRKVPVWPAMGNHDSHSLGAGAFSKFYGLDSLRYSFDFRNARFICLPYFYHTNLDKADNEWLEKQLAEGQKAGKLLFVYQHCPAYAIGGRKPDAIPNRPTPFTQLLTKYGIVADFSGHEHIYYRTKRDGVWFMTTGLGGKSVYSLGRVNEAIEGDVYYGATGGNECKFHSPKGDKVMEKKAMFSAISVDGAKVTGKLVTAEGDVLDEYVLREGK